MVILLLITADLRKHVGEGSGKNDSPAKAGETGDDETTPGALGEVYLKKHIQENFESTETYFLYNRHRDESYNERYRGQNSHC